ncbi:L,D-transpeptidase [Subtercola sp. RTI3]|uniref:L,D-transpeptidase n=1 Tax=Subtercola sp. RTI3 TaxID=3048639 RepID=UPI002B23E9D4|nr:L,D-transpeptidase [Subtercola sp. RTI3]MEA9984272.1 L,D-transpeptidase [Subtercola sp. RTI3]
MKVNLNATPTRLAGMLILAGLAAATITGCTAETPPTTTPPSASATFSPNPTPTPTPTPEASVGTAAIATGPTVDIYDTPGGTVTLTMTNPQPSGAPLTYLVDGTEPGWLKVDLPIRPNGSTGWITANSATLTNLTYRVLVSTEQNILTVYQNDTILNTYPVATGTGGTPTPHGSFYLLELLAPTNTGYGPYAFGLSAFSDALTSFGGGPGQIGLHGTDDAASIGHPVSHGCIRMTNTDITTLATLLPLGTPITIQ